MATPAMYVAATAAIQQRATTLVNELPIFEQTIARQALFRAGLFQGFAKVAVDAALAEQQKEATQDTAKKTPAPPMKAKEDAKT